MAASIYPHEPGTEHGPCKEVCKHKDCAEMRKDAKQICRLCNKPIGYNNRVYLERWLDKNRFVHADCFEREIEAQNTLPYPVKIFGEPQKGETHYDNTPLEVSKQVITTGVRLRKADNTIEFEFSDKDFKALVEFGLQPVMGLDVIRLSPTQVHEAVLKMFASKSDDNAE